MINVYEHVLNNLGYIRHMGHFNSIKNLFTLICTSLTLGSMRTARVIVVVLCTCVCVYVYVCVYVCVTTHNCRLTHWNHKTEIPTCSQQYSNRF